MDGAIRMDEHPFGSPDTLGKFTDETIPVSRHFVDCHPAVMDIGDIKTAIPIKIRIVGPILMIRTEMTRERQTIRIKTCYPVIAEIGDE